MFANSFEGWQERYMAMRPKILARIAFMLRTWRMNREEAIQDCECMACEFYERLAERGEESRAFPGILARNAVRHFLSGRRFGTPMRSRDVYFQCNRFNASIKLNRIVRDRDCPFNPFTGNYVAPTDCVLEMPDFRNPAHAAKFKIDFMEWLQSLSSRMRKIAIALALGYSTTEVSKQFGLSLARISQLRRELLESWREFNAGDNL